MLVWIAVGLAGPLARWRVTASMGSYINTGHFFVSLLRPSSSISWVAVFSVCSPALLRRDDCPCRCIGESSSSSV